MNKIENLFKNKGINRGGIKLYSKSDALIFIEECKKEGITVLGIDGFYLTEDYTKPTLENSIDFSSLSLSKIELYLLSKKFLMEREENLFFEIVFDE